MFNANTELDIWLLLKQYRDILVLILEVLFLIPISNKCFKKGYILRKHQNLINQYVRFYPPEKKVDSEGYSEKLRITQNKSFYAWLRWKSQCINKMQKKHFTSLHVAEDIH